MKDNQLSWTLAILIHLLFLLFLYLYQVNFPKRLEVENIEVIAIEDFIQQNMPSFSSNKGKTNGAVQSAPAFSAQSKISLPGTTTNFEDAVKIHNLPMKKSKVMNANLMSSNIDESFNGTNQSLNNATSVSDNHNRASGSSQFNNTQGNKASGSSDGSSSFKLEGEVVNRQLLKKVIPKYPDDMQRDGVVSLKFTVLPDGTVSDILIIKKSDPVFENLSISSLNQWRFNRSDKKNTGIISFHFKLE